MEIILIGSKSNTVTVSSVNDLNRFIVFAGGEENILAFTPFGWCNLLDLLQSNNIEDLL